MYDVADLCGLVPLDKSFMTRNKQITNHLGNHCMLTITNELKISQ